MCRTTLSPAASDALFTARTAVIALVEELAELRACTKLMRDGVGGRLQLSDFGYFARTSYAKVLDAQNLADSAWEQLGAVAAVALEDREPERPAAAVGRERMRLLFTAIADEKERAKDCGRCGGLGTVRPDGRCDQCGWLQGEALVTVELEGEGCTERLELERGLAQAEGAWAAQRLARAKGVA